MLLALATVLTLIAPAPRSQVRDNARATGGTAVISGTVISDGSEPRPVRRVREMSTLVNGFPFDSEDFSAIGDVALVRIRDLFSEQFETFVKAQAESLKALIKAGVLPVE